MDRSLLRKFAIESRYDLMGKIENKIKLFYVDEEFSKEQKGDIYVLSNDRHTLSLTYEQYEERRALVQRVQDFSLEQVIEEAAYTWFNRIIAIRYMEINDMLPLTKDNQSLGVRVLSSKDNTPDPEILKFTNLVNPDLNINFRKEKYVQLGSDNEKFEYVLLLVCKKLGKLMPVLFGGETTYINLLIPDNLLSDKGFVTKVVKEVPEECYKQVEVIGWLYQYYNQTEKDRVIASKKVYKKNEIAYATQLFTPDWIVKYMVENSLGRYWIEHSEDASNIDAMICNWKYFIKDNICKKEKKLSPTEITFIDPCCGSGHVLVYAFELFYQIYQQAGYNKNDIPELILKNNLFGLDIDNRAGQLSILSVILKAREYDKYIFNKVVVDALNIMSISESMNMPEFYVDSLPEVYREKVIYLNDFFRNAKEIGSLLVTYDDDYDELEAYMNRELSFDTMLLQKYVKPLIKQNRLLAGKYDVVVTNPPYMNNNVMSSGLKNYIGKYYKWAKSDLFSAFMIRNSRFGKKDSYLGYMTPYVWMFISSYEKLREYIINDLNISSLIQLEYSALDEATVPICSFVLKNSREYEEGIFIRLTDFTGGMKVQDSKYLEIIKNKNSKYYFKRNCMDLLSIPGSPIAYWIGSKFVDIFKSSKSLGEIAFVKQGIATSDNNRFLRLWFEVSNNNIFYDCKSHEESLGSYKKWYPYNKGGEFRKWYGNNDYVVNWQSDGYELRNFAGSVLRNP